MFFKTKLMQKTSIMNKKNNIKWWSLPLLWGSDEVWPEECQGTIQKYRVVAPNGSNFNQWKTRERKDEADELSIPLPSMMWLFQDVVAALENTSCGWATSCFVLWGCDQLRTMSYISFSSFPVHFPFHSLSDKTFCLWALMKEK